MPGIRGTRCCTWPGSRRTAGWPPCGTPRCGHPARPTRTASTQSQPPGCGVGGVSSSAGLAGTVCDWLLQDYPLPPSQLVDFLCLNDCSGHGQCSKGDHSFRPAALALAHGGKAGHCLPFLCWLEACDLVGWWFKFIWSVGQKSVN